MIDHALGKSCTNKGSRDIHFYETTPRAPSPKLQSRDSNFVLYVTLHRFQKRKFGFLIKTEIELHKITKKEIYAQIINSGQNYSNF